MEGLENPQGESFVRGSSGSELRLERFCVGLKTITFQDILDAFLWAMMPSCWEFEASLEG